MGMGVKLGIMALAGNAFENVYSLNFDGSDDVVSFTKISRNGVFTFSYWFKLTDSAFGNNGSAFIWGVSSDNSSYVQLNAADVIRLKLNGTIYTATESGGNNLSLDTWHNMVIVRNSSNSVQIYLDGATFGSAISSTNTITFGSLGRVVNSSFGFQGNIDEVFMSFNDQTDNVSAIYNGGIPGSVSSFLPQVWFRMGDVATFGDSNWTLVNQGSNGNNAVSANMAEDDREEDVPS
tara:strand:- start:41 stop:745 length:705 start_codon:yes stop_codon:yes gene_type:complete